MLARLTVNPDAQVAYVAGSPLEWPRLSQVCLCRGWTCLCTVRYRSRRVRLDSPAADESQPTAESPRRGSWLLGRSAPAPGLAGAGTAALPPLADRAPPAQFRGGQAAPR